MRRQTIAVLDIGDRPSFARSRLAAIWTLDCLAEGRLRRGQVRDAVSRDREEIARYLLYPTRLMHVMAHGHPAGGLSPERRWFWPFHCYLDVREFAEYCSDQGRTPDVECLLLDACTSNTAAWRRGLEALIPAGRSMVLIGTRRKVGWPEATTFTTGFYSVLLAEPLPDARPAFQRRVLRAYDRASRAFELMHGQRSVFRADVLEGRD